MDYFFEQEDNQKTLIIGIGNEFRSDDGVGLYIARKLQEHNFPNVAIFEKNGEGTELMETWQNYNRVFIFDAVRSGAEPGTVFRICAHEEKIPPKFFNYSTHDFSLAEAVELARVLNELPASVIIYGVEGQDFSEGWQLSDQAMKGAQKAIEQAIDEIKDLKKLKDFYILNMAIKRKGV
jgi:hydrogenase maturation protease